MVAKINKKPSLQPIYNVIYNKIQIYIFYYPKNQPLTNGTKKKNI